MDSAHPSIETPEDPRIAQVLDYWFGDATQLGIPGVEKAMDLWFGGTDAIDRDIEKRFLPLMDQAALGRLDPWARTPRGTLAIIVLLDQFSLNVYRDQPRSFTQAHRALPYALAAIRNGQHLKLEPLQRTFVYLPLEHAEDIYLQNEALELFSQLVDDVEEAQRPMFESFLDFAERHQRVIKRFGRFPDRNPILGRVHMPEEEAYMRNGGPDF